MSGATRWGPARVAEEVEVEEVEGVNEVVEPAAAEPEATAPEPPAPARLSRGVLALTAALVVVGLLALAGGVVYGVRAHQLGQTESARNLALVDSGATTEVVSQVSAALGRVFSYDHASPDVTSAAADEVLVGDAAGQYDALFATLRSKAEGQDLVLRTTVVRAGVSQLDADSAALLVFLDQTATRGSDGTTSTSAAQLSVRAERHDGVWKLSSITPL